MKKKNMLMCFLILVCTLFFVLPVQARTTEVSRVMNRKMSSAAYELGMRHVPSMNRRSSVNFYNRTVRSTRVTYAAKGKYSSNCSYLQGETYYKNKAGRWNVCIRDTQAGWHSLIPSLTGLMIPFLLSVYSLVILQNPDLLLTANKLLFPSYNTLFSPFVKMSTDISFMIV